MLRKRLGKTVDIKIFDIRDKFTYTPGLHVTVGDADYLDGIQFSLPAYYGSDFVHAEVTKITKAHELHTATGDVWMFDYAVIAT